MGFAWITWYDFTDDEYQAEFDARKGVKKTTTSRDSLNESGLGAWRWGLARRG